MNDEQAGASTNNSAPPPAMTTMPMMADSATDTPATENNTSDTEKLPIKKNPPATTNVETEKK